MKWSYCLGRFAGATVHLHVTVLLYLLGATFIHQEIPEAPLFLSGIPFALVLLFSVFWHELAHARVARRVGVGAKRVYITPLAGFTLLAKMPLPPARERAIAWAGLAATLYLAVFGFLASIPLRMMMGDTWPVLTLVTLSGVNAMLFLSNVLPLYPTDGGRILRSLLAEFLPLIPATAVAAVLSTLGTLVLLFLTWHIHPILWIWYGFVLLGAWSGYTTIRSWERWKEVPVHSLMQTDFQTVEPYETLAEVAARLREDQQQFPVVKDGTVVGILTRSTLERELERQRGHLPVRRVMCREVEQAQVSDTLGEVYFLLVMSEAEAMVVLQGEELVGLLCYERVQQLDAPSQGTGS